MRKHLNIIIGTLVFVASLMIILSLNLNLFFFPTREAKWKSEKTLFYRLLKEFVIIQKLPMKKNYISGVEICLGNFETPTAYNEDVIFFTNSKYEILYTYRLSSDQVPRNSFVPIKFNNKLYVGRQDTLFICLYSSAGSQESHILCGGNQSDSTGNTFLAKVNNGDVTAAIKGPLSPSNFSMAIKTYESDMGSFSLEKIVLILIFLCFSLLIVFYTKVRSWIITVRLSPERSYLIIGGITGLILLFITPPFNFVDEDKHFYRAYQVSEFQFIQYDDVVPKALTEVVANNYMRMYFGTNEKTSPREILSTMNVKINPYILVRGNETSSYLYPYIPQAIGITIGKIFNLTPVLLLYLARLFNLVFALFFIYKAIRMVPVGKWIFFLLAVMPMTISQCSSASYDVPTYSLAFFLMAWILKKMLVADELFDKWDFLRLGLMIFFLSLCKPPYYLIGFLALLIPVKKIGGLKKFSLAAAVILISMAAGSPYYSLKNVLEPVRNKYFLSASRQQLLRQTPERKPSQTEKEFKALNVPAKSNLKEQKTFIFSHPKEFTDMMLKNLFIYGGYFYLKTFVGIFGWVTNPLPRWLVYSYLIMLILTALAVSDYNISILWYKKLTFLVLFVLWMNMIIVGFYLFFTNVGAPYVEGVQGRYFIPFSPLFFLFFINVTLGNYLNYMFSPRKHELVKLKTPAKKKAFLAQIQGEEQLFTKFWTFFLIIFSTTSILCTIFLLLSRYYIICI